MKKAKILLFIIWLVHCANAQVSLYNAASAGNAILVEELIQKGNYSGCIK